MAEELIQTRLGNYLNYNDCINYPKMFCYGWELLYKEFIANVITALETHSNASRLYLLIQFDITENPAETLRNLNSNKLTQLAEAIELTKTLKDIMPDACPVYLDVVGEIYAKNYNCLCEYIELITTKKKNYPKLHEYKALVKHVRIVSRLTVNFNIVDFLSMCPDPVNYFKNAKVNPNSRFEKESLIYLCEKFTTISKVKLRNLLSSLGYNLSNTVEALQNDVNLTYLKRKRKSTGVVNFQPPDNIEYLKEIAYLDHKEEILNHIETQKVLYEIKVREAKIYGRLNTCQCCFNDEVLDTEIYCCPAGHYFCAPCIKKGVEVAVGLGKMVFLCFTDCTEQFNLDVIKLIVDEKLYDRVMRLKQAQEVKEAAIEGLDTCEFCDYSVILAPDCKTVDCQNPECKKQTCRLCREESHFPFKCDEIEKVTEVKVRTMIEDKMTEVLIRTCYHCMRKFVKEDGCNKMTCSCGKEMCYICRKPIASNYTHFYHTHMVEDKCPLYTDENIVHATAVEAAARLIVNELKVKQPDMLRHIDIEKILPSLQRNKTPAEHVSALDINRVVATVIGQTVEDIKNLKDMRSLGPPQKKARR